MADKWDTICYHDPEKIKYILSLLNIRNGSKILDVGTGTGVLIPFLREKITEQGKITAIDQAEKMIEVAKAKFSYDNLDFIIGNVLEVPLPNEYYDYIICYSVFPHFDDKAASIKTIAKLLKRGGKFIICHSQSREAINNIHKRSSAMVAQDDLPRMEVIKSYFKDSELETISEIDNQDMFVIIARK